MNNNRYEVCDFEPHLFGGWEKFSKHMHEYYVEKPWYFGYKCPNCDRENFDINNNATSSEKCSDCKADLVSFFSPKRTKRYFSRENFYGKVLLINNNPAGWVLCFQENLSDFNNDFSDQIVLNIAYVCFLPEYRKKKLGKMENFRRFFAILISRKLFTKKQIDWVFKIIGRSPMIELFAEFSNQARKEGYEMLSAKIRYAKKLENLTKIAGFKKLGPWKEDKTKNIWILQL